jgi:hypothetical protein
MPDLWGAIVRFPLLGRARWPAGGVVLWNMAPLDDAAVAVRLGVEPPPHHPSSVAQPKRSFLASKGDLIVGVPQVSQAAEPGVITVSEALVQWVRAGTWGPWRRWWGAREAATTVSVSHTTLARGRLSKLAVACTPTGPLHTRQNMAPASAAALICVMLSSRDCC